VFGIDDVEDNQTWKMAVEAAHRGVHVIACVPARSVGECLEKLFAWSSHEEVAIYVSCIVARQVVPLYRSDEKNKAKLEKVSKQQLVSLGKLANLPRVLAIVNQNRPRPVSSVADLLFLRSKGSSGSIGMIGLNEVLSITPRVGRLIEQRKNAKDVEDAARSEGMNSILEDGLARSAAGIVSLDDILALTEQK
jgi:type II secretory ATPase GspE/PulE/Tfp pilus assembly ATPase PilB-like protein